MGREMSGSFSVLVLPVVRSVASAWLPEFGAGLRAAAVNIVEGEGSAGPQGVVVWRDGGSYSQGAPAATLGFGVEPRWGSGVPGLRSPPHLAIASACQGAPAATLGFGVE